MGKQYGNTAVTNSEEQKRQCGINISTTTVIEVGREKKDEHDNRWLLLLDFSSNYTDCDIEDDKCDPAGYNKPIQTEEKRLSVLVAQLGGAVGTHFPGKFDF